MLIDSSNQHAYKSSAPIEVFFKFYNKPTLQAFYLEQFLPSQGMGKPHGKLPGKLAMAEEIVAALSTPQGSSRFFESLSKAQKNVYGRLLWEGPQKHSLLEESLGVSITHKTDGAFYYGKPDVGIKKAFALVALENDDYWIGYNRSAARAYPVSLPPAVASLLRPVFPKPAHYALIPQPDPARWQADGCHAYSCEDVIFNDLSLIHDFLVRGDVARLQSGRISTGALRKIHRVTSGKEFFDGKNRDTALNTLRTQLLVEIAEILSPDEARPLDAAQPDPATFFRNLPSILKASRSELFNVLMPHLVCTTYANSASVNQDMAFDAILGIFSNFPGREWVSTANLVDYVKYRGLDISYFPENAVEVRVASESTALREDYQHSLRTVMRERPTDLFDGANVRSMAMLLTALGCLEVICPAPSGKSRWMQQKKHYLTPFDGLRAVRLTETGAYVFGQSESFSISVSANRKTEVKLHPERLHAIARSVDPVTESVLKEFMEPLGQGLFRMTRETLLRPCNTAGDVSRRVASFRERMTAEIPPRWESFLADIEAETAPLQQEQGFRFFTVKDNEAVRRLFLTDPVLLANALKVEGGKIAIHRNDLGAVKRRLRSLGYFFDPR